MASIVNEDPKFPRHPNPHHVNLPGVVNVQQVTMSPTVGKISKAIAMAQASLEALHKDGKSHHGKYATLSATLDAVMGAYSSHSIAIVQCPGGSRGELHLTTLLSHESGEWIASTITMSTGAKGAAQDVGSAVTYARRYALQAMVGIAPEDDDGAAAHRAAKGRKKRTQGPAAVDRTVERGNTPRDRMTVAWAELEELHADNSLEPPVWGPLVRKIRGGTSWPGDKAEEDDFNEAIAGIRALIKGFGPGSVRRADVGPDNV